MQNNMQITANWSRSKSEVEFQYGGRLYFETGSSYISAADISTKFGLLIDFDLLKAVTSTDSKPEVVFSRRGRHLEKWKWRHISAYFGVEQLYTGNLLTVALAHYTHYIIRTMYYIQGAWGDENIFAVLYVTLLWALHIVIKQQFCLHLYILYRKTAHSLSKVV